MSDDQSMELEESGGQLKLPPDPRPHMEEPLPVRLVAVADVRVPGHTGLERELSAFYEGLWGFERDAEFDGVAFWAENFRLIFEPHERPVERDDFRPVGVEVQSLAVAQQTLSEREIEHTRQKGIQPGTESILLRDPAGNWVELTERREL